MSRGKPKPPHAQGAERHAKPDAKHWIDKATALFAFVAMMATGFAAYFTGQQWIVSRDAEHRQLRAYVGIKTKEDAVLNTSIGPPNVTLMIKNYGNTPASNIHGGGRIIVLPYPLPGPIDEESNPKLLSSNSSLFPTADDNLPVTGESLSREEVSAISDGSKFRLYIFAQLTYDDIWGERHFTHFCMMNDPAPLGTPRYPIYCDRRNDSN